MNALPMPRPNETPKAASPNQALDFDFDLPDWNGQQERASKLSPDELLRYCEAMLPVVQSKPGYQERRIKERCTVEFEL